MKITLFAGLLLCALSPAFAPAPAMAAVGDSVHVPYGDLAADLALSMMGIASAAIAYLFRNAPGWLKTAKVDQALDRGVQFGLNAVANAVRGKALDLNTGNQVANMALDYVASHVPSLVKEFGVTKLREKILARLTLDDAAELSPPAP